ncbi:MAG TPA: isochorismatase family cysteine hydrolase [Baekduia sp.]|nr:isochorismatase family cysteine hydrolase [Baekduia sp.]
MPIEGLVDDGVVIVIDMIKDSLDQGEEFAQINAAREMVPKLSELLEVSREHGIPIVHAASQDMRNSLIARHWWPIRDGVSLIAGSPTVEVVDELRPAHYSEAEVYLSKGKYSCFYGTRLDIILRNPPFRGRNTLIITGIATNFCCLCTAADALNRDYDVVFVDDLNCTHDGIDGTPAETMHRVTVETLKQGYVSEVVTADGLLGRLRDEASVAA